MANNLFGERFLSLREPAWHGLGLVVEEELTAVQAFEKMGPYDVELQEMVTAKGITVPGKAIVRTRVKDAGGWRDDPKVYDTVGDAYHLVTPQAACLIWDGAVGEHVETIGALGDGEILFITTKLPTFDIKGDEVQNYLLMVSPMMGGQAAESRVTPVRVVCQNTLIAARQSTTELYKIVHDHNAKERLGKWMNLAYTRSADKSAALKAAFELMAEKSLVKKEIDEILAASYPLFPEPKENAPEEVMAARIERWETKNGHQVERRDGARDLFDGRGTGMEMTATRGTAWGLYNAVVECEDYRKGNDNSSVSAQAVWGGRAQTKERAFDACLKASQN